MERNHKNMKSSKIAVLDNFESVEILEEVGKGSNRTPYLSNSGAYEYVDEDWRKHIGESDDSPYVPSSYLNDGTCGIDKVRIGVPLDPDSVHPPSLLRKLIKPRNPFHSPIAGKAKLKDFPELFVKWDYAQNLLEIEFNPSDFTRQEGLELCPFGLPIPIVEFVIRRVVAEDRALPVFAINDDYFTGAYDLRAGWTELVNISRIDLARDLLLTHPKFSLEQLRHTYPRRSRSQASSQFRNNGRLNTLSFPVAEGTTSIKLYDKYEERKGNKNKQFLGKPIELGTFRFEASFPREQLTYINMKTLDLFIPKRLEKMIKAKWEDSKYWVNLVWGGQSAFDAHTSELPKERINEVLGFVHCANFGIEPNYSYREIRALKADARKLGITGSRHLEISGKSYGHIDFISGVIVSPLIGDFSLTEHDLFGMI
jgi:hypothetical protein